MRIVAPCALLFVFLVAPLLRADDGKKALDLLQGKWDLVTLEENGQRAGGTEIANFTAAIKGDKLTFLRNGKGQSVLFLTLDPTRKPATVDLTPDEASKKKKLGIYKLEGDTLTICGGDERSAEFKGGKGIVMFVLKKQK